VIKIFVKGEAHSAGPPLKVVFYKFRFGQNRVFSAHVFVIPVIRFNGNDFSVPDMGFDDTVLVAAAVTLAASVNYLCIAVLAGTSGRHRLISFY